MKIVFFVKIVVISNNETINKETNKLENKKEELINENNQLKNDTIIVNNINLEEDLIEDLSKPIQSIFFF